MTNKTKMTITEALVELKKLDAQIKRSTKQPYIGYVTGVGVWEKTSDRRFASKDEAEKAYTAALDQVQSYINRRNVIKSAVVLANARTLVKIASVEMTIAEAIERKMSIGIKEQLLQELQGQLQLTVSAVTRADSVLNNDISSLRDTLSSSGKLDEGKLAQASKDINDKQKTVLVDPNGLMKLIEKLHNEIEDFKSNVDVVLSIANATTEIEIQE